MPPNQRRHDVVCDRLPDLIDGAPVGAAMPPEDRLCAELGASPETFVRSVCRGDRHRITARLVVPPGRAGSPRPRPVPTADVA